MHQLWPQPRAVVLSTRDFCPCRRHGSLVPDPVVVVAVALVLPGTPPLAGMPPAAGMPPPAGMAPACNGKQRRPQEGSRLSASRWIAAQRPHLCAAHLAGGRHGGAAHGRRGGATHHLVQGRRGEGVQRLNDGVRQQQSALFACIMLPPHRRPLALMLVFAMVVHSSSTGRRASCQPARGRAGGGGGGGGWWVTAVPLGLAGVAAAQRGRAVFSVAAASPPMHAARPALLPSLLLCHGRLLFQWCVEAGEVKLRKSRLRAKDPSCQS